MVSAVVFAKDHRRVANFYVHLLSARVTREDAEHADLDCGGFRLVVQRIRTRSPRRSLYPTRRDAERTAQCAWTSRSATSLSRGQTHARSAAKSTISRRRGPRAWISISATIPRATCSA